MSSNIIELIDQTVKNNQIVLYMKGSKEFPQCGFSATVVQILNNLGANFLDIDVLRNNDIRQGIKEYADWPTIPQLYISGEFIGGCDIVKEMFNSGDLESLLKSKNLI